MTVMPKHVDQAIETVARDGTHLIIRPVKPEDAPMFLQFHETLSKNSLYNRFFRHVTELTPTLLDRLTHIDDPRKIALVALAQHEHKETMTGVVRIIGRPNEKAGDFFIIVTDAWQDKGIGTQLLTAALDMARSRGYDTIYGATLPENEGMRHLARKMGFQVKFNFEEKVYDLILNWTP